MRTLHPTLPLTLTAVLLLVGVVLLPTAPVRADDPPKAKEASPAAEPPAEPPAETPAEPPAKALPAVPPESVQPPPPAGLFKPMPAPAVEVTVEEEPPPNTDPRRGEAPLPTKADDWDGFLLLDNDGVGVWTVKCYQVFDDLGCPEIVALDDWGRLHILVSYSGKWTDVTVVDDGRWLGGLAHDDLDPRIPGAEIYTGSQRGNVYQVVPYPHGVLDYRLLVHLPGREVHTVVVGDLDPSVAGRELIAFTRPGGLYRLTPTGEHGTFETTHLQDVPGRVRDAVVLPAAAGHAPEIATVSRNGSLRIVRFEDGKPTWKTVYAGSMGMGRITMAPPRAGRGTVLYTTHDDGRILRHVRATDGTWATRTIYLGPQGPRGLAAGRFDADFQVETVATFGYGKRIQLLSSRDGKKWTVETLLEDEAKGHWLTAAEVDGRNSTHEIVGCGFGGRVVMVSRPPGYGRRELAESD